MNSDLPFAEDLLAPDVAREIDRACDRFEAEWASGNRPALEGYLAAAPAPTSVPLFRELLLLEIAYRTLNGERPSLEQYQQRFPGRDALIVAAFEEQATGTQSVGDASTEQAPPVTQLVEGQPPARPSGLVDRPTLIGKYRIVEWLGGGAQGDVFRAIHPNLPDRDVVIKWARETLTPAQKEQMLAEGRILARLDDPGLVRVHDVDTHEGRPFLVVEYVAGKTLHDRLAEGPLSFVESARLIARLAHTLDRVHSRGILHRDLKPHNILIGAGGQPRLIDFGLAHTTSTEEVSIGPARVCGTLAYMPPEQARGQEGQLGPRSDVFGLGAVLYELLTGRPPYLLEENAPSVWEQASAGQIVPPRQREPKVPRRLDAICRKALAADPAQRYPTAGHLERALLGYVHRGRRRVMVLGAVVALVSLFLACLALFGPRPQQPLTGELKLTIWGNGPTGKPGLPVDQPGALPVRNGEMVHLEVRLNQPAYIYLIYLDGQGAAQPLYPWPAGKGFTRPPPSVKPIAVLHRPEAMNEGYEVDGPSSLDTMLLLVRRTPLPAEVDLAARFAEFPPAPFRAPEEYAVRGFDPGQPTSMIDLAVSRGLKTEAKQIDDALVTLMERLRSDFELVRAVRFAHVGADPVARR